MVEKTDMERAFFRVDRIGIAFGGNRALNNVSFSVQKGEILSIIGPNGAGKSTLFNCINHIYSPDSGRIILREEDITKLRTAQIARKGVARTFQNIELFKQMTVLDNLLVARQIQQGNNIFSEALFSGNARRKQYKEIENVERIIDFLDLQAYRDMVVHNLPFGILKIVELGKALATEPSLLLLDEPVSGMNNEEKSDFSFCIKDINRDMGLTIILVEHDIRFVMNISDRIIVLDHGSIIGQGTPEVIQRDPEVIKAYLGKGKN